MAKGYRQPRNKKYSRLALERNLRERDAANAQPVQANAERRINAQRCRELGISNKQYKRLLKRAKREGIPVETLLK